MIFGSYCMPTSNVSEWGGGVNSCDTNGSVQGQYGLITGKSGYFSASIHQTPFYQTPPILLEFSRAIKRAVEQYGLRPQPSLAPQTSYCPRFYLDI